MLPGSDDDDRTAAYPTAQERNPDGAEHGAVQKVQRSDGSGREERMRGDDGLLRLQIVDELGTRTHAPARAGHLDLGIAEKVADPVGPTSVGRDGEQSLGEALAGEQYLARQAAMEAPRAAESEGIVRGLSAGGMASPAYMGSTEAINAARRAAPPE